MKKVLVMVMVFFFVTGLALAAEKGTAKEAKQMVDKGVAYIKANGKDKALAEFNNPAGKFINKDLYLFALDFNGITLAQGGNPKLVGKNMMYVQDADKKYFIQDMISLAKSKGNGWLDYKWTNPRTKKVEDKSTYVQRYEDFLIGCGIYK
ncbi:MAG: cache domain-containing protein [Syntrophales bacterium LBB04]|nr:cache domain-containing protein [Syntrophales bacterium LBB04]